MAEHYLDALHNKIYRNKYQTQHEINSKLKYDYLW